MLVEGLMKNLNETEQLIIQMRYFDNRTQMEIAKEVGVSQVQISRMEKKILMKILFTRILCDSIYLEVGSST